MSKKFVDTTKIKDNTRFIYHSKLEQKRILCSILYEILRGG